MTFPKVKIEVLASGIGTILLDGVDISNNVQGFNVRARAGELTRIFIVLAADAEIETEGVITKSSVDGKNIRRVAQ